ncbi:MAG: alcohol dehydrogenase catalytic domain-containing protein [Sporichthyaceae bacterium]
MRAAQIVEHNKPLVITDVPDPVIGSRDAIVQVEATGMCRSDWHTWRGDWKWLNALPELPWIPGHEFGGTVTEVGPDVTDVRVGDRVTVPFTEACGKCESCSRGRSNVCWNVQWPGYHHSGGYGEYVAVLNADLNCIRLPDSIDMVTAAGLSCRFSVGFNAVTHIGRVRAGEWVSVIGTGGMGMAAVQVAAAVGANVIAIDIHDDVLQVAKEQGAVATLNASSGIDVPEAVHEITGGGAHVSIDCYARGGTTAQSVMCLRRSGRHVQAGLTTKEDSGMVAVPVDFIAGLQLEFLGASAVAHGNYPEMLSLVSCGRLNPASLVTKRIDIHQVNDSMLALENLQTGGAHVITSFH